MKRKCSGMMQCETCGDWVDFNTLKEIKCSCGDTYRGSCEGIQEYWDKKNKGEK